MCIFKNEYLSILSLHKPTISDKSGVSSNAFVQVFDYSHISRCTYIVKIRDIIRQTQFFFVWKFQYFQFHSIWQAATSIIIYNSNNNGVATKTGDRLISNRCQYTRRGRSWTVRTSNLCKAAIYFPGDLGALLTGGVWAR